ncbi:MAG: glucosidase [Phycisphaerales bacterium]|nr:glucosidase [Phycisphaerales bacterium]
MTDPITAEQLRLDDMRANGTEWRLFGPYLSDRQWGTVREDYSADGSAWTSFPHDHARSRAYRWGEDGLAGFCDERQDLCLSLALWNGQDPIVKERLFGLTNNEGNHGEDVKEEYWFIDAVPSGAWQKMLYKYPQRAFPYDELVRVNGKRSKLEREFELLDTGIFDDNRYFDVFVEYAKASPRDILMRVTLHNRASEAATIHVLPTAVFRNVWSWTDAQSRPQFKAVGSRVAVTHDRLGPLELHFSSTPALLFCENDTNQMRFADQQRMGRTFKDGINSFLVHGETEAINSERVGTKVSAQYVLTIGAGESTSICVRMCPPGATAPFEHFESVITRCQREADEFFASKQSAIADADARAIQRQAWAGLLWSQQTYIYDVRQWAHGDPAMPSPPTSHQHGRNSEWGHLTNHFVYCMPDSWEYPWFASWDLGFHCVALAEIDAQQAKTQLAHLMLDRSMHCSGQIPAYEWAFGDVNPPVHAWAAMRIFEIDAAQTGQHDFDFLRRIFHRLVINFTWWVNRKDADGRNLFAGGFLGLDNVGVFDRSAALPAGASLQQADGTAWMGMFALNMMRIAAELAIHEPIYQDMATKFFEHFLSIAAAMADFAGTGEGLWDDTDEFYYDRLRFEDGSTIPLRVQSIVGLLPLTAVHVMQPEIMEKLPEFKSRVEWFFENRPDLAGLVSHWNAAGRGDQRLFSLLRGHRMKRLLMRALDETQFLSEFGIRSMSRALENDPYVFWNDGAIVSVRYEAAEGQSSAFGGNSNWRGPIWFPVNVLLIESLLKFHDYYGDEFKIECPVGSGTMMTLRDAAGEIAQRLLKLFKRDASGWRPCLGDHPKTQADPHFQEFVHFHEYFDGTTGRGCGAAHQTGWTSMIASLITQFESTKTVTTR